MKCLRKKPVIGITPSVSEDERVIQLKIDYCRAIEAAGGLPRILYPSAEVDITLDGLDGILFSGGWDIDPSEYGQQTHPSCGIITPGRDKFELKLIRAALSADMPLLGICRGIQLLSVAMGGGIIQDIKSDWHGDGLPVCHEQKAPSWHGVHDITIRESTRTYSLYKKSRIRVNSFHHQAVGVGVGVDVGGDIIVSALADDGIIEAIESRAHRFAVGVQWHPELMYTRDSIQLNTFTGLVNACLI